MILTVEKISFALKMRKFWRMPEGILLDQTCVENVRKESCTGSEHGLRSEKRRCSYWIIMEKYRNCRCHNNFRLQGLISMICATEKGMYFWYLKDFESNGFQDNVDWQAYTEWEDLVNEKSVIKNVINPRMTAMGELVDENGNPINGQ